MSSRRKISTSANPHIIARGRKIKKRKKLSQNVVATIVGLLGRGTSSSSSVAPRVLHPVGMNLNVRPRRPDLAEVLQRTKERHRGGSPAPPGAARLSPVAATA